MGTIAFPQLLTGNIMSAEDIQNLWNYGTEQNSYSYSDKALKPWIASQS